MNTPAKWPDSAIPTLTLDEAYRVLEHDGTSDSVELDAMREEIIQDIEKRRTKLSEILLLRGTQIILDGRGAKNLWESRQEFISPRGIKVIAATDIGIGRSRNEDRAVVDTINEVYAGVDGMGGAADGDKAAQILSESILAHPKDMAAAIALAKGRMTSENIGTSSGACFHAVSITFDADGQPFLDASQAGDVHLMILDSDNYVIQESTDEDLATLLASVGSITPDEALYHPRRNVVTNQISPDQGTLVTTFTRLPLQSGQKVVLMSDGISDNVTSDEMVNFIEGLDGAGIVERMSVITDACMEFKTKLTYAQRKADGIYEHGLKQNGKKDNRCMIVIEIP